MRKWQPSTPPSRLTNTFQGKGNLKTTPSCHFHCQTPIQTLRLTTPRGHGGRVQFPQQWKMGRFSPHTLAELLQRLKALSSIPHTQKTLRHGYLDLTSKMRQDAARAKTVGNPYTLHLCRAQCRQNTCFTGDVCRCHLLTWLREVWLSIYQGMWHQFEPNPGATPKVGRGWNSPLVISFQTGVPSLPSITSPDRARTASWGSLPHPCLHW